MLMIASEDIALHEPQSPFTVNDSDAPRQFSLSISLFRSTQVCSVDNLLTQSLLTCGSLLFMVQISLGLPLPFEESQLRLSPEGWSCQEARAS